MAEKEQHAAREDKEKEKNRAWQGRAGQGMAGQGRARQGRAGKRRPYLDLQSWSVQSCMVAPTPLSLIVRFVCVRVRVCVMGKRYFLLSGISP